MHESTDSIEDCAQAKGYKIWCGEKDGVCGVYAQSYVSRLQSVNDVGYGNRGKTRKKKKKQHVRALTFILLAEERQRVSAASQHLCLAAQPFACARRPAAAPPRVQPPPQQLDYFATDKL